MAGENAKTVEHHNRGGVVQHFKFPKAPGWRVWQDGKPIQFEPGRWLSVQANTGEHTYQYRYRPWDAWVGLAATLAGIVLAILVGVGRLLPFLT